MKPLRVQVVEDEYMVARDIQATLTDFGFEVTSVVTTGEDAITRAVADAPDAVLMDIHLAGEMDGIEAAEEIGQQGIPVCFLTSDVEDENRRRARQTGAFGFLVKPFSPVELRATLELVVSRAELEKVRRDRARLEATATLAAGLAHDFNNLLSVVLGNVEILRSELVDRDDLAGPLDALASSVDRASELTRQLVAFSYGGRYQVERVQPNNAILKVLRGVRQTLGEGVDLQLDLEPDLWPLEADASQLAQVLIQLFRNAAEATAAGEQVRIMTRNVDFTHAPADSLGELEAAPHVSIQVADTGRGMDPDVRSRLFEPFFSTKKLGRGMGLAAVYGIVRNHRGVIDVRSTAGDGTTVEVLLPALGRGARVPRREATAVVHGDETILLAEDNEMVADVTRRLMEGLGYRVLVASNGREAVEMAEGQDGAIDLMWVDMEMPVLDAPAAFPLLRRARPEAPVVLCSGYPRDRQVSALLEAGAAAFVRKPIRRDDMSRLIRDLLDDRRSE